jgi:hypothetical protein
MRVIIFGLFEIWNTSPRCHSSHLTSAAVTRSISLYASVSAPLSICTSPIDNLFAPRIRCYARSTRLRLAVAVATRTIPPGPQRGFRLDVGRKSSIEPSVLEAYQ